MKTRHIVAAAAAAAISAFSFPAASQEITRAPMTRFFVAIPLDGATRKDAAWNFGLQFSGEKAYQNVKVDYQTFRLLPAAIAAVEMKYIVVGAVAVGAAVAVSKKDSGKSASFAQQQQQQAQQCAATTNNCN
jgi:hypothetical protein